MDFHKLKTVLKEMRLLLKELNKKTKYYLKMKLLNRLIIFYFQDKFSFFSHFTILRKKYQSMVQTS